jgi:hypothetical protein
MIIPSKHSGYRAGIRLYPGGKGSSAPPPDPRLIAAQIKSMGIQDDAIQKILANAESMLPMQREQMQFGLQAAKTAYEQSQQDRDWMLTRRDQASEIQDAIASRANSFNETDRGNQLASEAKADVASAFANVEGQQQRALSRKGINPASGAALSVNNQLGVQKALGLASAANMGRKQAHAEGLALEDRANNVLAGYPAMAAGATGAGASYGGMGLNMANSGLQGMNSGFGLVGSQAGAMGQNATSMYGAQASYKNAQDQIAASSDPFNTLVGAAAGIGTSYLTGGLSQMGKQAAIKGTGIFG